MYDVWRARSFSVYVLSMKLFDIAQMSIHLRVNGKLTWQVRCQFSAVMCRLSHHNFMLMKKYYKCLLFVVRFAKRRYIYFIKY